MFSIFVTDYNMVLSMYKIVKTIMKIPMFGTNFNFGPLIDVPKQVTLFVQIIVNFPKASELLVLRPIIALGI